MNILKNLNGQKVRIRMSIEERIEILRIFAELEEFDFIREMPSEQLWKLMLMASMVLDVGKEKGDKE